MTRTPEEIEVQRAFFQWCIGWPDRNGVPTKHVMLAPGVELWHTPNGGERRDAFEGKRLKESGVVAGIHDILFLRLTDFGHYGKWGLLFGLEFKKPGGPQPPSRQLSESQQVMHPRLLAAGMAASIVVDNLKDARAFCYENKLTVGL